MALSSKVDGVFRTRSLGAAASGLTDQYADGKAAKVWQLYIGESTARTDNYKTFLVNLLKENRCKTVLDVACGTGVDSVLLLEEGFRVTSCDASDKMLKQAYKTRWDRRKESAFDQWVIEEANWLDLSSSGLREASDGADGGFDALLCMGNSFAHLPDVHGDNRDHRLALSQFRDMLRPGGVLVVDHRNYDHILDRGFAPKNNIYYNSRHILDIKTSVLYVNNHPHMVTLGYQMDVTPMYPHGEGPEQGQFRLSYYPHRVSDFASLLSDTFGPDAHHQVYADFKPNHQELDPAFYIHVVKKSSR